MPLDDRARIFEVVGAAAPRAILHCGAITNVDGCAEPLAAYRVSGLGTAWVADAAAACGAAVAYVSTDFVFDGALRDAAPVDGCRAALCLRQGKRLGEEAVLAHGRSDFVVRTSRVFGPGGPPRDPQRARSGNR